MDQRRLQYLQAMGIDAWLPRNEVDETVLGEVDADAVATPTPENNPPKVESTTSIPAAATPDLPVAEVEPVRVDVSELDWDTLESKVASCTLCDLHASRTQAVFGVGNRHADWMVIGEAPGAEEDRQGEPFVGRAGQLLTAMLKAIGLERDDVYIANILKCRPPNNRDPQPQEAESCTPFLNRQIELIQPKLILAVGKHAAHFLLKTDLAVGRLRGTEHRYEATNTPVVVSYHPAYLLRSPKEKCKAWEDLKFAEQVIQKHSTE